MPDSEGFFKDFHDTLNRSLDPVARNNFANLEGSARRAAFVCALPAVREYDLARALGPDALTPRKQLDTALRFKADGNAAVQKGDWAAAADLYSQSLLHMPADQREELSIVHANRSAALNHLEQHEAALDDIGRSLQLGYPRHLRYKVCERRARCLLVLKRNQEAVIAFQETISALHDADKLDKTKRQKISRDAAVMIEMLKKGLTLAGNPKDKPKAKPSKVKLPGKSNSQYPAMSAAVQIIRDDVKGRHAMATRNIEAGEVLLVEKPYGAVLLGEYTKTHCQNCFIKCSIPVICPRCPNVIFCSSKCLDAAEKSYHPYECHILPLIWKSGCSITCLIALRMVIQKPKDYFMKMKDTLSTQSGPHRSDDYKAVYGLLTHQDKRTKDDVLHRMQMAVFLIKMLQISGYFEGQPRVKPITPDELISMAVDEKYKEDISFFGELLFQNLQILQFNAHEVFELLCPRSKNNLKHTGKSVFIGGGVFPTLALFNHSCQPSLVRYFNGSTIVVRALKYIKKGEEVSENYGPIFTAMPKDKRLLQLKDQYWFDCTCVPCDQNWPTYAEMTENYMRFRCSSDTPCPNVVPVPHDTQEFMVQCGLCHQYTNILKGLKSLQDTDMALRLARAAMSEGKYGEAQKKFAEVLKLYDSTLVPPYQSYYDCIQDLKRCMLAMGNYSIV